MKTLLHELCKHKGAAIKDCLSLVPRDAGDGEPLILAYIDLNLQTLAAAGLLPSVGNSPLASPHTIAAARAAPTPSRLGQAPSTPQATVRRDAPRHCFVLCSLFCSCFIVL